MNDIFLLRHAPSVWNLEKRWQGQSDPELSELGQKQSREFAERLKTSEINFQSIWASSLKRAVKTASAIGEVLGIQPQIDERLRERNLGEWEGLTRKEIDKDWPGAVERTEFPPSSEADTEVIKRAMNFLDELAGNITKGELGGLPKVLVVCHGGIITCIEGHLGAEWERLHNLTGRWLSLENGSFQLGSRAWI